MGLEIKRDKRYKHPVKGASIHGKYAYKLYLEILGNSNIGRYIVVVSSEPIKDSKNINEINVQLSDKIEQFKSISENNKIIKPNMINQYYVRYRVREKSILDLMNTEMFIFRQIKQKK